MSSGSGRHPAIGSTMARVFGRSTSLLGGTSGGRGSGTAGRSDGLSPADSEDIIRRGYLKKYKNLRSRYYVLRRQGGAGSPAKLECYDSEQKFLDGAPAKRCYLMNQCISIHEKKDSKRPYAMSIFIKQDSCCLLAASTQDMSEWLEALQAAADTADWEHVWQVEVLARGLGGMHDGALAGHSYLCLTKRQLSLVKQHNYSQRTDVALSNIRGCSSTQHFFTLEMGRLAETGSGRIDLKVQDSNIASNIEIIVRQAMTELSKARDRTCSMSNTTNSHRDRSGSLPARPDSCGAAPSHSPGRWHPPWEESAPRLVDDGRGGLTLPCNRCPAHRAGGGGGGLDTYVLMDGTNTQQSTPYGGEVCTSCEAGCPSHLCSPIKGDERPSGDEQVAGAYLDMCQNIGRGTGVSSPSSTLSPVSPGLCSAHLHGHYSPGPLCCPVHCPPSTMSPRPVAPPTQPGGGYVNMAVAAAVTLPKPIPGSGTQDGDASHSSECSSYTSGGGGGTSPPSQHLCLHHEDDLDMDVASSRCRLLLRQDGPSSGHLSLDNESVQDVEDVVDDALEGRLQGAGSAGDMDLDMDIDVDLDGDQVDGGVPMMRSYGGGSISARGCLETSSIARHGGELREEDEARILRPQQLRPLRTSSVGSKQEHCRRKNSGRPEFLPEPPRARAFSVGSRMGLKLLGGLTGSASRHTAGCGSPASGAYTTARFLASLRAVGDCPPPPQPLYHHPGTVSPSSSGSSCSSFSPYTEYYPAVTEAVPGKGRPVQTKSSSAPMLGISCASRSWSDTSGSYFRTLDKLNEDHLMLDFTQSHKSYDYIAPRHSTADEAKEKKSLSIERIKSTILRHRTTSKRKAKRVSEGEVKSSSYRSSGIEIPNSLHEDYFMVDMNSSPRSNASNMSNTSTNSDTAPPGYLSMRPGASLSFSSTCSSEYISMEPITSSGGDTGRCQEATHASNCTCMTDTASDVDAYVDMSAGADCGLSLSVESSSSGSVQSHQRRMSCTSGQNTSLELVSPQEEPAGLSYLYDMDTNTSQKDKRSRKKESGKRKKSDPLSVEGTAEALRSKGSGHLSSFTSLLSRKNSQNSTTRTPLSPTGSPLPKSSRSSNSPFASLGRSKSKDGRDSCPPNMSSSPTSVVANTQHSINTTQVATCGNTLLSPVIRDTDAIDDMRCSLRGVGGGFPRNHSSKELSELNKLSSNRSSGPYDLTAGMLRTGAGGLCSPCAHLPRCSADKTPANWGAAAHHQQHRFQELHERGREGSGEDVLNIVAGRESSNSAVVNPSSFSADRKCSCTCTCIVYSKYPCTMLTEADKVGQTGSHSSLSNSNPNSADLGRLSESSLEDTSRTSVFFNAVTPNVAQETANYVNMGPVSCVDNYLVLGDGNAGHISSSALYTPRTEERKILNTDQGNNRCNSLSMACTVSSDYLDMDMRKNGTSTSTSNASALANSKCTCTSSTPAPVPSLLIPQQSSASVKGTSAATVVRRPALPPLVLAAAARTDPLVPLERLSLVEKVSEEPENKLPGALMNTVSSVTQASDALLPQCCATPDHNSGSFSERCRSHSGPGAPEASSFGTGNMKRSAAGDAGDRGRDGSSRALSACNSPVSYSPPTSPNLASSSKSSLSEGGMSSASSTCTVVNVGLRLQQQNHRHSHGSGSSMCTNADATTSVTVTTPNTSSSSAMSIVAPTSVVPSALLCLDRSCASSQPETRSTAVQKIAQTISHLPRPPFTSAAPHEVEYACLDLAPPQRGMTGSSNDGSPASKRRALPWLEGISNTPSSSVSAAATTNAASGSTQSAPKEGSNDYTEIDFQKSESLRNACMLAATLRH